MGCTQNPGVPRRKNRLPAMRGSRPWPALRVHCRSRPRGRCPPATPIPFRNAIELALQHSGVMGIAAINQWRAHEAYLEVRANYIPQAHRRLRSRLFLRIPPYLGRFRSLGGELQLQHSRCLTVALQKYIRRRRMDWNATSLEVQDKRDAVILDTALSYTTIWTSSRLNRRR